MVGLPRDVVVPVVFGKSSAYIVLCLCQSGEVTVSFGCWSS